MREIIRQQSSQQKIVVSCAACGLRLSFNIQGYNPALPLPCPNCSKTLMQPVSEQETSKKEIVDQQPSDLVHEIRIYSYALWNLYNDICKIFYGNLPPEKRQKVIDGLPCGISEIEGTADKLLMRHVALLLDRIGPQEYAKLVRDSMTQEGWAIFLLRCLIACLDTDLPDKLTIRTNKTLNALELAAMAFAQSHEDATKQEFVDDDGKRIDISRINVSGKFSVISISNMKSSKTSKDRMPVHLIPTIGEALEKMGIKVPKDLKEAWSELESRWKAVSIDEKIVSRVAYLIMNSTVNRNSKVKVELLTFQKK